MRKHIKQYFFLIVSYWTLLPGAFAGAAIFIIIYGIDAINPLEWNWLFTLTHFFDTPWHAFGGMFYIQDAWRWPPFLLGNIRDDMQNVYSIDGIPIFAWFWKIIYPVLWRGELIQYMGAWGLICYMLQGVFSTLIARLMLPKGLFRFGLILVYLLSYPLLDRYPVHCALSAHWLILWGLWLYLKPTDKHTALMYFLLLFCAALTHPYISAMILLLCVGKVFQLSKDKSSLRDIAALSISIFAAIGIAMYMLGYFSYNIHAASAGAGYGQFSINLNGLFNPVYQENSALIAQQEVKYNQHMEGLCYLGAGLIFMMLFYLPMILKFLQDKKRVEKYYWLLWICLLLTLFALGNRICYGDNEIFHIYRPQWSLPLLNTFRASGRFFWPVYYLLILLLFKVASQDTLFLRRNIVLLVVIFLQLYDIVFGMAGSKWSKFYLHSNKRAKSSSLDSKALDKLAIGKKCLFVTFCPERAADISHYALRNQLKVLNFPLTRPELHNGVIEREKENLLRGKFNHEYIYILSLQEWMMLKEQNQTIADKFEFIAGMYVLSP